ncbi:VCBS repeat-containing protein [Desulfovibrio sp. OttesenSCG-928-F20]|nr:VCBS repeat-containing protein [Desulfovibrio sp. OttesenSCG-928-F20]
MHIRLVLITAFALTLFPLTGLCYGAPFITLEGCGESVFLTAEEIGEGKDAVMEAAMPDPVMFILRRGSPNGINLTAVYGDAGENILGTLPPAMKGFDDYGELEEGFALQCAVRDLNGDGKPEVLVATGDGAALLTVVVFVYTPGGNERFRAAAVIEGQSTLHVDVNGVISVPYGSQGLFTEYTVSADGEVTKKE